MNSNFKNCKVCGKEMPKNAEICLECGAKNKKPIYTRVWFIVVCVLVALAVIGAITNSNKPATPGQSATQEEKAPITYEDATVDDMMKLLKENALNAKTKYDNKHLKLKGRFYETDSDGKYITLVEINKEWAVIGVKCYIKNEDQLNQLTKIKSNDIVELTGKITDVNGTFGYSLDIDSII